LAVSPNSGETAGRLAAERGSAWQFHQTAVKLQAWRGAGALHVPFVHCTYSQRAVGKTREEAEIGY
jgi:hypothetical protein